MNAQDCPEFFLEREFRGTRVLTNTPSSSDRSPRRPIPPGPEARPTPEPTASWTPAPNPTPRDGVYIERDGDGNVLKRTEMKNGLRVRSEYYRDDGSLRAAEEFSDEDKQSKSVGYDADGAIRYEHIFETEQYRVFDSDGNVSCEGSNKECLVPWE